jgi:hypothetical protein
LTGLLDGQTVLAWRDLELDLRDAEELGSAFSGPLAMPGGAVKSGGAGQASLQRPAKVPPGCVANSASGAPAGGRATARGQRSTGDLVTALGGILGLALERRGPLPAQAGVG